jgi:hypothetical protein
MSWSSDLAEKPAIFSESDSDWDPVFQYPLHKVQQWHQRGCVLACVTMFTGQSPQDIMEMCVDQDITTGATHDAAAIVLAAHGFWMQTEPGLRMWNGMAGICSVPSLNMRGAMHSIVWDRRHCRKDDHYQRRTFFYDPNEGRTDREAYSTNDPPLSWAQVEVVRDCRRISEGTTRLATWNY